ncbi:oligosaccharide flippase family protein [Haloplanus sp. C73]|uniref:lipopolysaccharide biosynthesis protein n=1 Tax=Haloplanus sp. C73 TaxID=3421641 RepID=UPI003EB7019E
MSDTEASDVSLGGETLKATLAKFTMAVAGLVGTIVFARLLGPVGIGGYYLLMTVIRLSTRPVGGLSTAVQKRLSESGFAVGEAMTITTSAALAWTALNVGVAYLLRERLKSFVGFEDAVLAFGVLLGTLNLFILYQGAISATGRIGWSRWIDTTRSYLTLPAQLALVWVGLGAAGMAYGEAIATAILLVPIFNAAAAFERPTLETAKSIWEYAKYSIPNRYLSRAYSELDILILGVLLTETAAGHYGVAFRLSIPAMFIAMVASSGLFSRVSNLRSKDEPIAEDVHNTLSFTSLFAIPMLFGGAVLDRQLIVTLYGSEFGPAAPLLTGLLLFQLVRTQSSPLEKVVGALDRPNVMTRVYALLLVVNTIIGVGFTLWLGAIGVVIATILAETLRYAVLAVYLRRDQPVFSLFPRALIAQLFSGVLMGSVLVGAKTVVRVDSWLILGGMIGGGAVVYFTVLFAVSRRFRETVLGTLDDLYPAWRDVLNVE